MKEKLFTALRITLGICLLIASIYKLCTAFSNSAPKENIVSARINEIVADEDGVEFCVTKVSNKKKFGNDYSEVKTDNNFVVVNIEITNNSNEPYSVNGLNFLLLKGEDEYQYDEETVLLVENYLYLDTINPNLTEKYTIVYETPTTTKEDDYLLKIEPVGFSNDGSVFISLK